MDYNSMIGQMMQPRQQTPQRPPSMGMLPPGMGMNAQRPMPPQMGGMAPPQQMQRPIGMTPGMGQGNPYAAAIQQLQRPPQQLARAQPMGGNPYAAIGGQQQPPPGMNPFARR